MKSTPYFNSQVQDYCRFLEDRGRKGTTIRNNRLMLASVLHTLEAQGRPTRAEQITEVDVTSLIKAIRADRTEATAKQYVQALTGFLDWAGNPVIGSMRLLWNRTTPTTTRWMDAEQLRKLLEMATPPERMALALGAMMGMRRAEIGAIELGDLREGAIIVRGKGHGPNGKIDPQPMPPAVERILNEYLEWRETIAPRDETRLVIWKTKHAPGYDRGVDPASAVSVHLASLSRRSGIDFTPHSLRRLFAETVYDDGNTPLTIVRDLMRHEDVQTTQRYIRRNPNTARAIANAAASRLAL